jgi:hypothetical protein
MIHEQLNVAPQQPSFGSLEFDQCNMMHSVENCDGDNIFDSSMYEEEISGSCLCAFEMNSISMCNSSGSRILFDISNEQKDAYGADQESVQVEPGESCDRFSKRKEVVDQMKK